MKPFSTALGMLLATHSFVSADLYTFTLSGGGIAYLTSADHDLNWNGVSYHSGTPRIDRSAISQKTGLQVSSIKISVYPTYLDTIANVSWMSAFRRGMFDGASVQIDRAFASAWGQAITGVITMLKGRVADVTFGRSKAEIEVNSWTELLSNVMPRAYYQSPCNNVLGDARCGINRELFAETGTIIGTDTAAGFATSLPAGENWLAYGIITMTSGVCGGESRPVAFNSGPTPYGNRVQLQIPLSVPPALGDSFVAFAGCDKTQGTCQTKFNNLGRFAGYPYIPAPETAL